MIEMNDFDDQMSKRGWVILECAVSQHLVEKMLRGIENAYEICRKAQFRGGVSEETENTVHHLPILQGVWLEYLETMAAAPYIERFFGGPFVLNSFGGALNQAHSKSYAHEIHRDQRSYSGALPLMLNSLVMLDDFTKDNGATWLMYGGHKHAEKPKQDIWDLSRKQAIAPAGSVLMFDSNLWHAGGENKTDRPRRSVTPIFSKPFIRQECDYCRAIGWEGMQRMSPTLKQILGWNSRTPINLGEFYRVSNERFYLAGQG